MCYIWPPEDHSSALLVVEKNSCGRTMDMNLHVTSPTVDTTQAAQTAQS